MKRLSIPLLALLLTAAGNSPSTIDLPAGFAGEGIATGIGSTFYAGSLTDGRIARGDLQAGTSEVLVSDPTVVPAVGLWADVRHGLLWVAGGPSGSGAVYDLDSGQSVATLDLTAPGTFINDVVVTREAAYFTDSFLPQIYRVPISATGAVGTPETIALSGPAADFVEGFNINGIEATANGKRLIVVNSSTGRLFAVDAVDGSSTQIDTGDALVTSGDGLLRQGNTLYVLENGAFPGTTNQVVVIRLSADLSSGQVVDTLTSPLFETATTLARHGSRLAAVNAQFAGAPIDPESEVVIIDRH